jgi:Domain of unknown function (DUF4262)
MPTSTHSTDPFLNQLDETILMHGMAVIPVGYGGCSDKRCCGPAARQPWTYTVGLSLFGLPELVLMGLDPVAAHFALSWVADEARAGRPIAVDRPFVLRDVGVKLVEVPDEWLLTDPDRMAVWFGHQALRARSIGLPRVHQVVWADADGRFPDDASCRPATSAHQPILRDDPFSLPHRSRLISKRPQHGHRKVA